MPTPQNDHRRPPGQGNELPGHLLVRRGRSLRARRRRSCTRPPCRLLFWPTSCRYWRASRTRRIASMMGWRSSTSSPACSSHPAVAPWTRAKGARAKRPACAPHAEPLRVPCLIPLRWRACGRRVARQEHAMRGTSHPACSLPSLDTSAVCCARFRRRNGRRQGSRRGEGVERVRSPRRAGSQDMPLAARDPTQRGP